MWSVRRIYPQPVSDAQLVCASDEAATTVELYDDVTRTVHTVVICWSTIVNRNCANLELLTDAGYAPNDWDATCAG